MLLAYYDKSCDSEYLFKNLKISTAPSFRKYLNKYTVIYLDITLFISRASDIKHVIRNINEEVREEFVRAVTVGKYTETAKLIRNSEHLLEATLKQKAYMQN